MNDFISLKKNRPTVLNSFNEYLVEYEKEEEKKQRKENALLDLIIDYRNAIKGKDYSNYMFYNTYSKRKRDKSLSKAKKRLYGEKRYIDKHSRRESLKKNKNKYAYGYDSSFNDYYDKSIYFYDDIENRDDPKRFSNAFEFDNYLGDEIIDVDDTAIEKLRSYNNPHCCIKNKKLLVESDYSTLWWRYNGV